MGDTSYIHKAFNWLTSYLEPHEWQKRKLSVLNEIHAKKYKKSMLNPETSSAYSKDVPALHLLYAECMLTPDLLPYYDFYQGATIVPSFVSIGRDLELIRDIKNIEHVVRKFLNPKNINPETEIFELLVALLYKRNSYKNIEFIPEGSTPSPDLKLRNSEHDMFIECKKIAKTSDFSRNDADRWRAMWLHLREGLRHVNENYFFEIIFHRSLEKFNEEFLAIEILPKLKLIPWSSKSIIKDDDVFISVRQLDLSNIKNYLADRDLKLSSQFIDLATGEYKHHQQYTFFGKFKDSEKFPTYISDVYSLCGATWCCDDEDVINAKSRDIKRTLAKAVKQFEKGTTARVHLGLETIEGIPITKKRFHKIVSTLKDFVAEDINLTHVICHFFEGIVPPDKNWIMDQSTVWFERDPILTEPFDDYRLFNQVVDEQNNGVYWTKV